MSDATSMTRYLLGELSEDEQAALEERYAADPRLFDEVAEAESDLIDDYVRGKLAPEMRGRFERVYLANLQRRERVRFAEALLTRVDREAKAPITRSAPVFAANGGWQAWFDALRAPKPVLGLAFATLLVASGVWLVFEVRRTRQEVVRSEAARADGERRDRDAQAPSANPPGGAPLVAPLSSFVVLALEVGPGVRAADRSSPTPLVIPANTIEVRLQLHLRELEYPTYRVILRAVGGGEILRRDQLSPTPAGSGGTITLSVSAGQFESSDYLVTLQGTTRAGDFDDLSQSLIRIDKK